MDMKRDDILAAAENSVQPDLRLVRACRKPRLTSCSDRSCGALDCPRCVGESAALAYLTEMVECGIQEMEDEEE